MTSRSNHQSTVQQSLNSQHPSINSPIHQHALHLHLCRNLGHCRRQPASRSRDRETTGRLQREQRRLPRHQQPWPSRLDLLQRPVGPSHKRHSDNPPDAYPVRDKSNPCLMMNAMLTNHQHHHRSLSIYHGSVWSYNSGGHQKRARGSTRGRSRASRRAGEASRSRRSSPGLGSSRR